MITEPIVILGAPRSGTTIVQRCLAVHPDVWHLPAESHAILEGPLHPARSGYESNRAGADQLEPAILARLRQAFYRRAINLDAFLARSDVAMAGAGMGARVRTRALMAVAGAGSRLRNPPRIRFVEKTPKNMLRVPFLERLFPDARYVWLTRCAEDNVDSLIAGWHAVDRIGPFTRHRFAGAGYPIARQLALQDYHEPWWKFALIPGWRRLQGATVADVALRQFFQCNRIALEDLGAVPGERVFRLRHEEFVRAPVAHVRRLLEWAGLPPSAAVERFAARLPRVNAVGGRRSPTLRYAAAMAGAFERLPAIESLRSELEKEMPQ